MYKIVDIMHNIIYTKDSDFYIITIFSIERNDIIMPSQERLRKAAELQTALNELCDAMGGDSPNPVQTKFTKVSKIISSAYGNHPSRRSLEKIRNLNTNIGGIIWQTNSDYRRQLIPTIIQYIDRNKEHLEGIQAEVKRFLQKVKTENPHCIWANVPLTIVLPGGSRETINPLPPSNSQT